MECNRHTGRYLLLHNNAIRAPPAEAGTGQPGSRSLKISESRKSLHPSQSLPSLQISEPEVPGESGADEPATFAGWIADLPREIPDRILHRLVEYDEKLNKLRIRRPA